MFCKSEGLIQSGTHILSYCDDSFAMKLCPPIGRPGAGTCFLTAFTRHVHKCARRIADASGHTKLMSVGSNREEKGMKPLWITPLIFLLPTGLAFGQQPASKQESSLCRLDSLPTAIQHRLKQEYGSWRVQEHATSPLQSQSPSASEGPVLLEGRPATVRLEHSASRPYPR